MVRSTRDGSLQPSYIIVPAAYNANSPAPLMVALHTWSFSIDNQRFQQFEANAELRNWIYLAPEFRGVDDHPEACGSDIAQQDILDAVAWTRAHLKVDDKRIYIWGWSGGGHMALLMASRAPDLWAAVSAWAGITDLGAYYRESDRHTQEQLRACLGGAPGTGPSVDLQYRERSPLTHLDRAVKVPIDIWNGRDDTDVSPSHAMFAFNKIAQAAQAQPISSDEIPQLTKPHGTLDHPQPADRTSDPALGLTIFLRRTAGPSRITVFEGGHMTVANPTFEWFEAHKRQ
jgi:dipeptidyl aminopeptidase/acylaminoacyl peptidase